MDMNLAKSALTERFTEFAPLSTAAADYDVVRRAIAHIRGNWRSQPEIDVIANAAGVSATDLHHLFRRWCGLTPKAFLQALTLNSARELLRSSASILDTAYEVGLSGPGRLHDLFVTHEAMSPGEWKAGGEGLTITYGFHPCPFGMALVMTTPRGLAGLALADAGKEMSAAVVVDDEHDVLTLYRNGAFRASSAFLGHLSEIQDVNNWLGRSQFKDAAYVGSIDELRIYGTALSSAALAQSYSKGPNATVPP